MRLLDRVQYDDYPPVYAMVFTGSSADASWVQLGEEMYAGMARKAREKIGYGA